MNKILLLSASITLLLTACQQTPDLHPLVAQDYAGKSTVQFMAGEAQHLGHGGSRSYKDALRAYRAAYEQHRDANAANNIGVMIARGQGHEQSYSKARSWFERAGEAGSSSGYYNLGLMAELGAGQRPDTAQAIENYRIAARQGNPQAHFKLSMLLRSSQPQEAQRHLRLAAMRGHMGAAIIAGMGIGSAQGNPSHLSPDMTYEMASGHCPCPPRDLKITREEVRHLVGKSQQGDAVAQYNLALRLLQGDGVANDPHEAARMLLLAARQGYAPAQYRLGKLYRDGHAVMHDPVLAYAWLELARQGRGREAGLARVEIDQLESRMTTEEVVMAQNILKDWTPSRTHDPQSRFPMDRALFLMEPAHE